MVFAWCSHGVPKYPNLCLLFACCHLSWSASSVSVGLLAWATQTISSLTAALEADDVTALQDLPIPALLGISTPAIRPALHAAIKRALSRESRLQLIRRSIALAEQGGDDADLSVEAKAIRSILTESSPNPSESYLIPLWPL